MQDLIGRTLGHYRILERIGAGGMGVVYRAHDERLDRDVAIKVLPEEVAQTRDRLARFEHEAKALAALNHPNIAVVHGFESFVLSELIVGADFIPARSSPHTGVESVPTKAIHILVMELLEGESLRERIAPSGMGWQRATEIAAAVAEGLAAAHGKGIVHRDLKPENIFITSDGRVKILDFGLARMKEPVEEDAETATLTPAGTEAGTVMGTLGYMSPEQLRGDAVDERSDIFALGCVLYEMLAGRSAFLRASTAETTAAILKEDPPTLSDTGTTIPAELERTVRRCLEKRPEARFQSVSDLAYSLRSITTDYAVQVITPTAAPLSPTRRRVMWIGASMLIIAAAGALSWILIRPSEPDLPPMKTVPLTSFPGRELFPAVSPDGNMVAFVREGAAGFWDLYVMLIGESDALMLSDSTSDTWSPSWSPDSQRIAYCRRSRNEDGEYSYTVESVSVLGGQRRQLTALRDHQVGGLSWSPDGRTLAMTEKGSPDDPSAVSLLSFETGNTKRLTAPPEDHDGDMSPRISPDGQSVAFVRWGTMIQSDIFVVSVDGGEPTRLTTNNGITRGLDWAPDGKNLIFAASRAGRAHWISLWRVSVGGGEPEAFLAGDQGTWPSISRHGNRLCYVRDEDKADVWRVGGPESAKEDLRASKFISSTRYENCPEYSPDGQQILFGSYRSGADEIWICDSDSTDPRQLTKVQRPGGALAGSWSPDGTQIAFFGIDNGNYEIYVVDAAGGIPNRLTSEPSNDGYVSWSRDGKFIYFGSDRTGRLEVFKMAAAGGEAHQITTDGGVYAVESPDGKNLYFTKCGIEGGSPGIWRMPIDGGEAVQIHDAGGFDYWELLEEGICVIDRESDPPSVEYFDFNSGDSRQIAALEVRPGSMGLSISPDNKWILFQGWESESDIMLVENFR